MSTINTNVMSLNSQRNLNTNSANLATTIQRLSSGLRINSAKDDAAGLAISERFTTQIRGMNQAARNANDGISLSQTAEGALAEVGNNLQRIRELAVQSRNATNSAEDRQALQKEVDQLKAEIDRVATTTEFNGTKLLDGSFTSQVFQVGANQGQTIDFDTVVNASIEKLGEWTSVAEAAKVSGAELVAPAETTTPGAHLLDLGSSDPAAALAFEINGTAVNVTAQAGRNAADFAAAVKGAIDGAGVTGLTATVNGNNIDLSNTGANAVEFTNGLTATVAAQTTSSDFAAITAGQLTINGTDIVVASASSASGRLNDLVKAINDSDAGVTASVVDNKLSLVSKDASKDIVIAGASATTGAGLTAATTKPTAAAEQVGFKDLDISTVAGADNAILAMDAALKSVNSARADLGAVQNRFQSVITNLNTSAENLSAARGRIRDTDYARETAELTRTQILSQAGTAMLAQANQVPQNVLSLLR